MKPKKSGTARAPTNPSTALIKNKARAHASLTIIISILLLPFPASLILTLPWLSSSHITAVVTSYVYLWKYEEPNLLSLEDLIPKKAYQRLP